MDITEITSVKKQINGRSRLAPYCRVSSDSADQLHSFAAQIRYYSEYAKNHPEYELADIYADEKRKSNNGQKPKYYVENSNPAIVSRETFEAVQELMKSRKTEGCKRTVYPLTGKLRCPECGFAFRRQSFILKMCDCCVVGYR